MASRARDTAPPGKEKRGTSPLHPSAHHLKSPNSPKSNSPMRKQAESTTSNKNVPNYLKPTLSSLGDNIHKSATLSRGRSFDKPPAGALQKTPTSSNPKDRILRSSSSFSGKMSSTSQKPLSDKLSRASHMTKDARGKRGTNLHSRQMNTTKATDSTTKKQDDSTSQDGHNGSTPKASVITDSTHVAEDAIECSTPSIISRRNVEEPLQNGLIDIDLMVFPHTEAGKDSMCKSRDDHDGNDDSALKASIITNSPHAAEDVTPQAELPEQKDDQQLSVHGIERDVVIVNNGEIAATDAGENNSTIEDQDELNENANNAEIEDLKVTESSILVENQEITTMEEEQLAQEASTSSHKEPEEITNEPSELQLEENPIKIEDENQKGKKEEDEERNQERESEPVQENKITVASSTPQCQVVRGKKESAVSNDVIEATASKLREQRKNRVKALAGAFETVISLQEPKV